MKKIYLLFIQACICVTLFAQITQPAQPASGPGSNNPIYSGVTLYDYGTNANADGFWLFEPSGPVPDSANVVVFIHGWGETNLQCYGGLIDRIIRAGNIVICPRYQQTADALYSTYTDSCAAGIQRALDTLQLPGHVKPRLYNYFIIGHSMGGVLVANLTALYSSYNLPKPLAALSMEPGADLAGLVLSDTVYGEFPSDVKYLIIIGNDDDVVDSTTGKLLFYETPQVPTTYKNLVRQFADSLGTPPLSATHFEPCSTSPNTIYDDGESNIATLVTPLTAPDAVDFYCYWKLWDALVDCALSGNNCDVAFGNTPQQKFMGDWSNGTPVTPLFIIPSSPASIEGIADTQAVQVYPNPVAEGSFNVNMSSTAGTGALQLFDVNGQKVIEQRITSQYSAIQCPDAAGIYFYRVMNSENEIVASGKLVIM